MTTTWTVNELVQDLIGLAKQAGGTNRATLTISIEPLDQLGPAPDFRPFLDTSLAGTLQLFVSYPNGQSFSNEGMTTMPVDDPASAIVALLEQAKKGPTE